MPFTRLQGAYAALIAESGFKSVSESLQGSDFYQPGDGPGAIRPQHREARQSPILSNPPYSQPGKEQGRRLPGHRSAGGGERGPLAGGWGLGMQGRWSGHMPPAQLREALPAASCEGHVCTAGPGPCAGLLWARWEGFKGKPGVAGWGRGAARAHGPRPSLTEPSGSQAVLAHRASAVLARFPLSQRSVKPLSAGGMALGPGRGLDQQGRALRAC